MRSPDAFFTDAKEKELALLVWAQGQAQNAKGVVASGSGITKAFYNGETVPNARILLLASDWISFHRGDGEEGGADAVCQLLGKPVGHFTPTHIANVEHAYRAAFLSITLSPAVSFLGAGAYELLFDPLLKEPAMRAYLASQDLDGLAAFKAFLKAWEWKLLESYPRNFRQFTGADLTGWLMGAEIWDEFAKTGGRGATPIDAKARIAVGVKAFEDMTKRSAPPPAAATPGAPISTDELPPVPVLKKGLMLSDVSLATYGTYHMWPLIWDHNRQAIGGNPNRVPVGISIRLRKKEKYSAAEIADAQRRSPTWRNYPAGG